MADIDINRTKLENLIYRVFDSTRLDIEIKDRFGHSVIPRRPAGHIGNGRKLT